MFSHFYTFPTYTLINNLITVPLMSFILMPLGLLTIILMPFNVEYISISLLKYFIDLLIKFIYFSNKLPSSLYYTGNISTINLAIFLFGFFWLCIWQTKSRFLGIILMLTSLFLMKNKSKPDFIFDYSNFTLGVKSSNDELKIYSNNLSNFKSKFWANWYGQKSTKILPFNKKVFVTNPNYG